ncbi:MAG: hypothetical protein IJ191_04980 [Treponema sp.]|nr:hypothetical protein [Treponema sp.]
MKRCGILLVFMCFLTATLEAEQYRIASVSHSIRGMSHASIIDREITIDHTYLFGSEDELMAYITDYHQRLLNTRFFAAVSVDFTVDLPDENGISAVHLMTQLQDSSHLIVVPYIKYNSNSGFELQARLRDSNFLGTLSTMSFSPVVQAEHTSSDESYKFNLGLRFSYDFPFRAGPLNASWVNDMSFYYTIGETMPEWSAKTGLSFTLPISNRVSFNFGAHQYSYSEHDYRKYGDALYFAEEAFLSLPIKFYTIRNWGDVTYTPSINARYNWDLNGINKKNEDLIGPTLTFSHAITTGRTNWDQATNLRTGISFSVNQSVGYNFGKETYTYGVSTDVKLFKGFTHVGFASAIYLFVNLNSRTDIGTRLRGIRDDQNYSNNYPRVAGTDATEAYTALVFNFDMPFHLFSTDFSKIRTRLTEKLFKPKFKTSDDPAILRWTKIFDIDVQLSPFIDIALTYNEATGRLFDVRDGFYGCGAELLLYPRYWKSVIFRISFGLDIGRFLFEPFIDTSWRRDVAKYELSIGVGLHY